MTAEQASAQATLQNFDAAAVDAGVLVIPAMAFYGGFLDLLASLVRARGRDIYAFTAPLVVEAVDRILKGATSRRGAAAPGEVFEAASYLRALAPEHVILEIGGR